MLPDANKQKNILWDDNKPSARRLYTNIWFTMIFVSSPVTISHIIHTHSCVSWTYIISMFKFPNWPYYLPTNRNYPFTPSSFQTKLLTFFYLILVDNIFRFLFFTFFSFHFYNENFSRTCQLVKPKRYVYLV